MLFAKEEFLLCGRWKCVVYDGHLSFHDYDKIFAYLRWKVPVFYEPYGHIMEGIVATYADGTSERLSWCELRDILEKHWYHLKNILREPDGEDLDVYTDKKRIYDTLNKETLTLDCKSLTFQTHQAGCCGFDRISGRVL